MLRRRNSETVVSHPEQRDFIARVKSAFPSFFNGVRTLEVGSLDLNGTVRSYFDGGAYTGLDVAAGPGVDVVAQGQDYDAPDGSFDTVISCEVMEHNPYWKETLANMIRVCRPGGLVLMTCASTGRKEHGTTRTSKGDSPLTVDMGWEYYRNLAAKDFRRALPVRTLLHPVAFFEHWTSRDLYMAGFKRGAPTPADAEQKFADLRRYYRRANWHYGLRTDYLKVRALMDVFGEERYRAGPIRPWTLLRPTQPRK